MHTPPPLEKPLQEQPLSPIDDGDDGEEEDGGSRRTPRSQLSRRSRGPRTTSTGAAVPEEQLTPPPPLSASSALSSSSHFALPASSAAFLSGDTSAGSGGSGSSSSFFSSSPPPGAPLSFINSILFLDLSCWTLCVANMALYFIGFSALLLLSHLQSSPPLYTTTYISGFYHAFHVWCCLGAVLLLFAAFSPPSSKKQRISTISFTIILVCVCTYVIFATQTLPVYIDVFGHQLFPLRYLEWICTTPLMLLLVCNLDVQPTSQVVWIVCVDVLMIVFGLFAAISPNLVWMTLWLTLSFVAQVETLWKMHQLFVHYRALVFRYQRIHRTIEFLEAWLYLTYAWFPTVWLLAALRYVDDEQTAALYFVGDTLGKMLYTAALLIINFEIIEHAEQLQRVRYEADMRVQLADESKRSEERSKRLAQTSNERKREFLRYLLHEVRVPLNALVLGLESLNVNRDLAIQGSRMDDFDLQPASSALTPRSHEELLRGVSAMSRPSPLPLTRTLSRVSPLTLSQSSSSSSVSSTPPPTSSRTLQTLYDEDGEAVHHMWISVNNMTRLLDDVLSLQRIEDGELVLERAPFHVQDTVADAVKMMTSWLDTKGLRVRTLLDSSLPPVISDEYRLRQILLNFLSNAIRFTPGSGPTAANDFGRGEGGGHEDIRVRVRRCQPFSSPEPSISSDWEDEDDDEEMEGGENGPRTSPMPSFAERRRSVPTSPSSSTSPPSSSDLSAVVYVRISVRDRGIGLAGDDLRRLFLPFVQINAGESEKGKGTGLGLSICRKLIEMLGGRIGVVSAPGKGSEFFVEVPLQVDHAPHNTGPSHPARLASGVAFLPSPGIAARSLHAAIEASSSSAIAPAPTPLRVATSKTANHSPASSPPLLPSAPLKSALSNGAAAAGASMRVLIVDDAESNRKLLARLVAKSLQATCDTARDGQEAVDLLQSDISRYDVILCDKEMPVLDGYGAVREMRAMGVCCPIIGVTANALINDQAEFMACGLDALVTKPVNMPQLIKAVRNSIHRRKVSRTANGNGNGNGTTPLPDSVAE